MKKYLPINTKTFGFVEREKQKGRYVHNKCGRDFFYYCLNYYFPNRFNPKHLNHLEIEEKRLFGFKISSYMAWTMLQFIKIAKFLKSNGLSLEINSKKINSFPSFILAILTPNRRSSSLAIKEIERAIDNKQACGIDITLGYLLLNHVMFVYGYDKDNLYVFDTHPEELLEYKKMTKDKRFIMKLPKSVIKKHWSMFGRVWAIKP